MAAFRSLKLAFKNKITLWRLNPDVLASFWLFPGTLKEKPITPSLKLFGICHINVKSTSSLFHASCLLSFINIGNQSQVRAVPPPMSDLTDKLPSDSPHLNARHKSRRGREPGSENAAIDVIDIDGLDGRLSVGQCLTWKELC
jgi:hypothetical protein